MRLMIRLSFWSFSNHKIFSRLTSKVAAMDDFGACSLESREERGTEMEAR